MQLHDMLGFSSKNAKDFILNCRNGISWQFFLLYKAFERELMQIYVIEYFKEKVVPT